MNVLGSKYGQHKWIHFNENVVTPDIEESDILLNVTHWVSVYERHQNIELIDLKKPLNDDEGRSLRDGESSSSVTKSKEGSDESLEFRL